MAMAAMRTMAASLKQKFPTSVQRGFASRRAPARVDPDLDSYVAEFRRTLEKIIEQHRKRRRNEVLACATGFSLGALTFYLGVINLLDWGDE